MDPAMPRVKVQVTPVTSDRPCSTCKLYTVQHANPNQKSQTNHICSFCFYFRTVCGDCSVNTMWNPQRHVKHTIAWQNNRTRPTRHHTMLIENTGNCSLGTTTKSASNVLEQSCPTPNKICPQATMTLSHLQQDAVITDFPLTLQQV